MVRRTAAPRAGFSLIELLIAMAIIAALTALLLVGLRGGRKAATRLQATNDISQLAAACTKFKTDYGFYPPSTFTIPNTTNPTAGSAMETSLNLLKRMFPRWSPTGASLAFDSGYAYVDTNNGTTIPVTWSGTLTPDQCLLFFLAGPNGQGWSVNDPNWSAPASATVSSRKPPYMDRTAVTVVFDPNTAINSPPSVATQRPRMIDPWKTPYTYLASTGSGDYDTSPNADGVCAYRSGGNRSTGMGCIPVNQGGVQIISAGPPSTRTRDRDAAGNYQPRFGPGSKLFKTPNVFLIWEPGSGTTIDPVPSIPSTPLPSSTDPNPLPTPPTSPPDKPFVAPYGPDEDGSNDIANFNKGAPLGSTPN